MYFCIDVNLRAGNNSCALTFLGRICLGLGAGDGRGSSSDELEGSSSWTCDHIRCARICVPGVCTNFVGSCRHGCMDEDEGEHNRLTGGMFSVDWRPRVYTRFLRVLMEHASDPDSTL
jgi:hypothetical protein